MRKIEETWVKTNKGQKINTREELEVIAALCGTLFYLEIYDFQRGERHKEYFIKRYLSLRNNMSQLQIAQKYGICRDTVSSYCIMYIEIFDQCLGYAEKIFIGKDDEQYVKIFKEVLKFVI